MPLVIVKMLEGRTVEQKRRLVTAITEAVVKHTGAPEDQVDVIIEDYPRRTGRKPGCSSPTSSSWRRSIGWPPQAQPAARGSAARLGRLQRPPGSRPRTAAASSVTGWTVWIEVASAICSRQVLHSLATRSGATAAMRSKSGAPVSIERS